MLFTLDVLPESLLHLSAVSKNAVVIIIIMSLLDSILQVSGFVVPFFVGLGNKCLEKFLERQRWSKFN